MGKFVDVIIPVYNQEKYLNRCLDSILPQTDDSITVVLVNDGSTDSSLEICRGYKKRYENIKIVDKANGGLASARNAGIAASGSEFIVFIDSDDYVSDDYIEWVKTNADENVTSACSYVVKHIDFGEKVISVSDGVFQPSDAISFLIDANLFNSSVNKIYSRRIIEKEPKLRFEEGAEPGEDLLFNCEYFKRIDKVRISGQPHYYYMRNGEDSLANSFRKNLWDKNKVFIKALEDTYGFLNIDDKNGLNSLSLAVLRYVHSAIPNMYRKKHKFKRAERLEFYDEILDSEKIALYISHLSTEDRFLNNLKKVYSKKSAKKMDRYYSFLMFVRNNFSWLYNLARKVKG